MDGQQTRALAQQFIDALHALEQGGEENVDGLVALYSEDAHLTNAALRLAGEERRGRNGVRQFWSEYKRTLGKAFSDFHQVTVNEESAGLFWTSRGTNAAGETMSYDGTSLLVFDTNGKIRFFQGYYDTREFNRQMGTEK